jgi:hypothetical protein
MNAPCIFGEVGVFSYAYRIVIEGGPNEFAVHSKGQQIDYSLMVTNGED